MLAEHHGSKVSGGTVREWMVEDGIRLSRGRRRQPHQPRPRRECSGELIQIDGSDHRWSEDRAPPCALPVFIDDAAGTLMEPRFVKSGSTFSHFEALEGHPLKHGRPVAFHSDRHTVFRVAGDDAGGGARITRSGRASSGLDIGIPRAGPSQAKGRVERANRTLRDRPVREPRLAGIPDMEAGNADSRCFRDRHNARTPAKPDNPHRAPDVGPDRPADVLCRRGNRYVGKRLTFSHDRRRITPEGNDVTRGPVGRYADTHAFVDGRFEVRPRSRSPPCETFGLDRSVTHAAITGNRRLSAVPEHIEEMRDAAPPRPKVRTSSGKMGYRPNGRRQGRPSGSRARKIAHAAEWATSACRGGQTPYFVVPPSFDHAESLHVLTLRQALQCGVDTVLGRKIISSRSTTDGHGSPDPGLARGKRITHRRFRIADTTAVHAVRPGRDRIPRSAFQPFDMWGLRAQKPRSRCTQGDIPAVQTW